MISMLIVNVEKVVIVLENFGNVDFVMLVMLREIWCFFVEVIWFV